MDSQLAIIGASVAGTYTALRLRERSDAEVRLYEARPELSPLPRSLIVTHAYRELLGALGEPAIRNEIRRFELVAGGRRATVDLRHPDLIIDRADLVASLGRAAREAGVQFRFGHQLRALSSVGGSARLEFTNGAGAVSPDVVVGADGVFSTTARLAGWSEPRTVPLVQALVELPPGLDPHTSLVWFVPEETPYFYWLIPESARRGALGVIAPSREGARGLIDGFAARQGFEIVGYQGACIPEYTGWVHVRREIGGVPVYLVGDAAGHVKVTTVGGIVDGIWGAEEVVEQLTGQRRPRPTGTSLRVELGLHLLIRKVLHTFSMRDYESLLMMLDEVSVETLGAVDRDHALALVSRLLMKRPRFAGLGLRGLLTSVFSPAFPHEPS